MKKQWEECGGRVLLGDNTGCVVRPIMFRCAGVRIAAGLPYMDVYIRTICVLISDLCHTLRNITAV